MTPCHYLSADSGRKLAYHAHAGTQPGVMFLGGFKSDMTGSKALALEGWCKSHRRSFTRFDYSGHGQSSGEFKDGCIGDWLNDALAVFDAITKGPQVLVGSSMGGWMMMLMALARPERVSGLVGIAAAPDFTTRLMWEKMSEQQQKALVSHGFISISSEYGDEPYVITHRLIEDSKHYLLLDGQIQVECPVRLLHGMDDADVPWQHSVLISEKLASTDVQVHLVKGAGHRFSEPAQIALICQTLQALFAD